MYSDQSVAHLVDRRHDELDRRLGNVTDQRGPDGEVIYTIPLMVTGTTVGTGRSGHRPE